ncbi:hypothetical protein YK48G_10580 [Lentilactobacillus fungorum]|uniref:Uncharacterized protein n=1 Tax=Lentilactobacillus fungorum TaxID=2201250 RepID=A0ABQ3VY44_9LACO|nr:SdpI family protein [Lentilactobacillus fungorum]GHP13633.1 hypothetical protein YK48G_10580 [Lentilactobacillus fungorum]
MIDPIHKISQWFGYRSEGARTSLANWEHAQRMFYGASFPFFAIMALINYFVPLSGPVAAFVIFGGVMAIVVYIEMHLE